jgi:hypothetical protein
MKFSSGIQGSSDTRFSSSFTISIDFSHRPTLQVYQLHVLLSQ